MGTLGKDIENLGQNIGERAGDLKSSLGSGVAAIGDKVGSMAREEGELTRGMERITAALPSSTWLALAGVSIIGSLTLKLLGKDKSANFVGEWAPTFLLIGVYNKLVKLHGSDRVRA
jgi:hypothetical protein